MALLCDQTTEFTQFEKTKQNTIQSKVVVVVIEIVVFFVYLFSLRLATPCLKYQKGSKGTDSGEGC